MCVCMSIYIVKFSILFIVAQAARERLIQKRVKWDNLFTDIALKKNSNYEKCFTFKKTYLASKYQLLKISK